MRNATFWTDSQERRAIRASIPALPHAVAAGALNINIGSPFGFGRGGYGGWWILPEPELHLEEDIVVPDIAGWRKERMPKFPNAAYCTLRPDCVCEVLSPSTRQFDTGLKRDVYAREGIRYLWMAGPEARVLEAFELRDGDWFLIGTLTDDSRFNCRPSKRSCSTWAICGTPRSRWCQEEAAPRGRTRTFMRSSPSSRAM